MRRAEPMLQEDLVRRFKHASSSVASHSVKMLDMARFGEALVAARFEVQVLLHDGRRLDPHRNLYFLRQSPDGWRVALVCSPAVSGLPPPADASAASPHGTNLKDD